MDGVAMTTKTDFSDDKVNDTHSYAGMMTADDYAKKRNQLVQDAGNNTAIHTVALTGFDDAFAQKRG